MKIAKKNAWNRFVANSRIRRKRYLEKESLQRLLDHGYTPEDIAKTNNRRAILKDLGFTQDQIDVAEICELHAVDVVARGEEVASYKQRITTYFPRNPV